MPQATEDRVINIAERDTSMVDLLRDALSKGINLRVRALGGSMRPFLPGGSIIIIQPVRVEDIAIGDVIFYHTQRRFFAHRVVRKMLTNRSIALQTKADALPGFDYPVKGEQIIGRVVALERNGTIVRMGTPGKRLLGYFISISSPLTPRLYSTLRSLKRALRRGMTNAKTRHS